MCHHFLVMSRKTQIYLFILFSYIMLSQKLFLFMEIFTFGPQLLHQLCWFFWLGFGVRVFYLLVCLFSKNSWISLRLHNSCYHPQLFFLLLLSSLFKTRYIFNYFIFHVKDINGEGILLTLCFKICPYCEIPTKNILIIILTLPDLTQSHAWAAGKQHQLCIGVNLLQLQFSCSA